MVVQLDQTYVEDVETWRHTREESLRAPDSWLALTGLYFLQDGRHTIGSAHDNAILLPAGTPAYLGVLDFAESTATLHIQTDAPVLVDGAPAQSVRMVDNQGQAPTLVSMGTVTFFIHRVGDQRAVRVRDSANPAIAAFTGCRWFPVDPANRIAGRFIPHDTLREVEIDTFAGVGAVYPSVGWVEFELHGRPLRLLARQAGPGQLSFVLRDATAGTQTYRLARFLFADVDEQGVVVLDFNKAINPPCAFTPYATCPLPPPENVLPVEIRAGEMLPLPARH